MFAGNNSDYAMKNKTNLQPLSGGSRDIDSLPLFMDPTVDWAFKFIFPVEIQIKVENIFSFFNKSL
jgi:hypothetical protein